MQRRSFLAILATALIAAAMPVFAAEKDTRFYELRTYYAAPGKLDALNAFFRDHACSLFEKHGITNYGYWTPIENAESKLVSVLVYPNKEAREASWKALSSDPAWTAAKSESETNGPLTASDESIFLETTDFSPEVKPTNAAPRVFELRTYTASPGNFARLLARFRNHTLKLFTQHGMTNLPYWTLLPGQSGANNTLIYLLAHQDIETSKASFAAFRANPEWIAAKQASEQEGGGSLTVADGVKSVMMIATDYSLTK